MATEVLVPCPISYKTGRYHDNSSISGYVWPYRPCHHSRYLGVVHIVCAYMVWNHGGTICRIFGFYDWTSYTCVSRMPFRYRSVCFLDAYSVAVNWCLVYRRQRNMPNSMLTMHSGSVLMSTSRSVGLATVKPTVARKNQFQGCMLANLLRILWLKKMERRS